MSDEQIIPTPEGENPGTDDGVGERVEEVLGSDGVRHIAGEFGDLDGLGDLGGLESDGRGGLSDPDVDPDHG